MEIRWTCSGCVRGIQNAHHSLLRRLHHIQSLMPVIWKPIISGVFFEKETNDDTSARGTNAYTNEQKKQLRQMEKKAHRISTNKKKKFRTNKPAYLKYCTNIRTSSHDCRQRVDIMCRYAKRFVLLLFLPFSIAYAIHTPKTTTTTFYTLTVTHINRFRLGWSEMRWIFGEFHLSHKNTIAAS